MKQIDPQSLYEPLRRERLRYAGILLEIQRKRFELKAFANDDESCHCLVTHYPSWIYANFTGYDPAFLREVLQRYPMLELSFNLPPGAELHVAPIPGLEIKKPYHDYAYEGEPPAGPIDPHIRLLNANEYDLLLPLVKSPLELKEPGGRFFAWFEDGKAAGYLSSSPFIEDIWDMDINSPSHEISVKLFTAYAQNVRGQGSIPLCSGEDKNDAALREAGFAPCCTRHAFKYKKTDSYYTTEMGPKLTEWVINKIKRDYPDDVALLIGLQGCAMFGDGHGECFDYFVPATERGYELERSIVIGGVHHDLYNRDWARCERTANLDDWASFCLGAGVILYSRSPEDTARFEALRQQLKDNLADPEFTYRKALERLDAAMNLYRNMMFEERPEQVRMAAGYLFDHLLCAALYLNGCYKGPYHHHGWLTELAKCREQPEQFEAYCKAMLGAKSAGELKSVAHLMIQSARKFIAARKPAQAGPKYSTNYKWLAGWYAEMTLTWRRLRFYCGEGNADCALIDACTLQNECNAWSEEYGVPEMDILSAFDCDNLAALSAQAADVERRVGEWVATKHPLVPDYASFEEFAEANP